jgi:hypothetical protein
LRKKEDLERRRDVTRPLSSKVIDLSACTMMVSSIIKSL